MARLVSILTLVSLASIGCGNGGGPADGGADGGSVLAGQLDDYATRYAKAFCAWQARCRGDTVYTDATTCQTWEKGAMLGQVTPEISAAVDAGVETFDPSAVTACTDALSSVSCDAGFPAACESVTHGQVAIGGTCYTTADCKQGTCGPPNDQIPCPATCVAYVETQGASCAKADCDPAKNLHCDFTSLTCMLPPAVVGAGQHCGIDMTNGGETDCDTGLYCTGADVTTDTCQPLVTAGGSCNADTPCAPPLSCVGSGSTGTCTAPVGVGGSCIPPDPNGYLDSGCLFGLACVGGTCAVPPASGPCGPDITMPCDESHFCDEATSNCLPLRANGAGCNDPSQCFSGNCFLGNCAVLAACMP